MSTTLVDAKEMRHYRDYLVSRNGDSDLLNRRLSYREEFFGEHSWEQPRWPAERPRSPGEISISGTGLAYQP